MGAEDSPLLKNSAGNGLFFKFTAAENRLVRLILENHGLKPAVEEFDALGVQEFMNNQISNNLPSFLQNNSVVVIWSSQAIKSNIYANLGRFQKNNHFPRSYELTRKDNMY